MGSEHVAHTESVMPVHPPTYVPAVGHVMVEHAEQTPLTMNCRDGHGQLAGCLFSWMYVLIPLTPPDCHKLPV